MKKPRQLQSQLQAPFLELSFLKPDWAAKEAHKMMSYHDVTERANASGKFYRTYKCWHFHKSSNWPLITQALSYVEKKKNFFEKKMQKKMQLDFFVLSQVDDIGQPVSIWHKDGYFFDGQIHLTIQGNANIEIENKGVRELLSFPNGKLWYLNGSEYSHRVTPCKQPRIELCAPVNQLCEDVKQKMSAVVSDGTGWVDGGNEGWKKLRKLQANYVKKSVQKGTASNLNIADFSLD